MLSEDTDKAACMQSDQSLCCPTAETCNPRLSRERPAKTVIRLSRLHRLVATDKLSKYWDSLPIATSLCNLLSQYMAI